MRYRGYPKYSEPLAETGATFPQDWNIERLRFSIQSNPLKSEIADMNLDELVTFVPMEAIGEYGGIDTTQEKPLGDVYSGYTYFKEGDILIAKITPCFENGKGAIAVGLKNFIGFGTTEFHVLRPLKGISTRWLFYLTLSDFFRRMGAAEMQGAGGQKRVPEPFIRDFRTGIPSLFEQQQIADFLDYKTAQIDALFARKKELIEKLREQLIAVITKAVTKGLDSSAPMRESGIEWLGEVPEHWVIPALKMRYKVELGKMLDEKRISGDYLVHYLRNTDVQWDSINFDDLPQMDISREEYDRYTIRENDVLVCEGGEVGRTAVVSNTPSVIGFQKALHRVRPEKETEVPRFLFYTLFWAANTRVFAVEGSSTISHLTGEQLRRYRFPQPPHLEQIAITEYLDGETEKIERLIKRVEIGINQLTEYRTALITAATTGKIDVRSVTLGEAK